MIEVSGLTKVYSASAKHDHIAIDDINFKVNAGEIHGIIGRSGAGKSTLIRCLNLLEKPTEGHIIIDGVDLCSLSCAELRLARQKMGKIFQHFNLLTSRTVAENIALPLEIQKQEPSRIQSRVTDLLKLVGLEGYANQYIDELSGGQKQRVAIARALASEPKILLSDEATSALDPETTRQILKLLQKINQTLGTTIVIITHEMEVVKDICHRVSILDHGKVVEEGQVFDVFSNPQHEVTKALTESVMKLTLPETFRHRLYQSPTAILDLLPIVKLTFSGQHTNEPVMSVINNRYDVMTNILQANVNHIQNQSIGVTICQLIAPETKWRQALAYLNEQQIKVEVLGYARADAF